jgi:hypothetical protein
MFPWSHPFDRLLPTLKHRLGKKMEVLSNTLVGVLAEGYIIFAGNREGKKRLS